MNTENPVWNEVMKMYVALCGDPAKFHKTEYIMEKLEQILKLETCWHVNVEQYFDKHKECLEHIFKKDTDG